MASGMIAAPPMPAMKRNATTGTMLGITAHSSVESPAHRLPSTVSRSLPWASPSGPITTCDSP